jgi:hypothetical protein
LAVLLVLAVGGLVAGDALGDQEDQEQREKRSAPHPDSTIGIDGLGRQCHRQRSLGPNVNCGKAAQPQVGF